MIRTRRAVRRARPHHRSQDWSGSSCPQPSLQYERNATLTSGNETRIQRWSGMIFLRIVILYLFDLSMISAQTRSAFVARENRYPLFRIMLQSRLALL
jgi:hypothetical protein